MSYAGWCVLLLLTALLLVAIWKYPIILLFPLLIVVVSAIASRKFTSKLRGAAAERIGEDLGSFARSMNAKEVDTWVIRAVWEELQPYVRLPEGDFPLRPDDRLEEDLRLDVEDLEQNMLDIAQRTGRLLENTEANPFYGRVNTVGDLVKFVSNQPIIKKPKQGVDS